MKCSKETLSRGATGLAQISNANKKLTTFGMYKRVIIWSGVILIFSGALFVKELLDFGWLPVGQHPPPVDTVSAFLQERDPARIPPFILKVLSSSGPEKYEMLRDMTKHPKAHMRSRLMDIVAMSDKVDAETIEIMRQMLEKETDTVYITYMRANFQGMVDRYEEKKKR